MFIDKIFLSQENNKMRTYNNSYVYNNEATLDITISTSMDKSTYIFNVNVDIYDHNILTSNELIKVYSSSFARVMAEENIANGSGQHSIHQRIISEVAIFSSEAAFDNNVSFDFDEFYSFATNLLNFYRSDDFVALDCFDVVSTSQNTFEYLFERDLRHPTPVASSVKQFAIKHGFTYTKSEKVMCDIVKVSELLHLNRNTAYKYWTSERVESAVLVRLIQLTDALLSNEAENETNKIKAVANS
ncbi:hypothetical protein P7M03_16685 [Vibrio parahaemolyticus]|nr:hypothetical protein [Vibrio parahaemolyticus]